MEIAFEHLAEDYEYETIKECLEDEEEWNVVDFKHEFLEYDENNH